MTALGAAAGLLLMDKKKKNPCLFNNQGVRLGGEAVPELMPWSSETRRIMSSPSCKSHIQVSIP